MGDARAQRGGRRGRGLVAALALGWAGTAGAGVNPCDDVAAERAALLQAASGDAHFADIAGALERRCEAPLAAGLELEGPASEAAVALADRLEAFCDRAQASGREAIRPGDREHLAEILGRPEFAQARAPDSSGLVRLAAWLTAWLETLFETTGAESFSRGTRVLVLALAIAVVLGVAFRLATVRRERRAKTEVPGVAGLGEKLEAPETHLARAGTILDADPRGAIREGLLALLSSLERRALARPDRVRTNREVAEEVAGRGAAPELTTRVRGLLGWYDRTYYSLERPAPPEARRFLDDVARLATNLREEPA